MGHQQPHFLAASLLYWHRLGCIVPDPDFQPRPWQTDDDLQKVMVEAHEQFFSPIAPTKEQKARAHDRIKAFIELDPPEWCRPRDLAFGNLWSDLQNERGIPN